MNISTKRKIITLETVKLEIFYAINYTTTHHHRIDPLFDIKHWFQFLINNQSSLETLSRKAGSFNVSNRLTTDQ